MKKLIVAAIVALTATTASAEDWVLEHDFATVKQWIDADSLGKFQGSLIMHKLNWLAETEMTTRTVNTYSCATGRLTDITLAEAKPDGKDWVAADADLRASFKSNYLKNSQTSEAATAAIREICSYL